MGRLYRAGEFAALSRISVRTLHHYDRIGLLRPSAHSDGGHRLYAEPDLLRLQQVLTLRYLGLPLRQIGELLDRPDFDLVASLRIQRGALRDRIAELERIAAALDELVERRLATGRWTWELVVKASTAIHDGLAEKGEKMKEYYTPGQLQQFAELANLVPPGERAGIERQWSTLITEVRSSRHLDPASAEAQVLADRWDALVQATFRGNQELMAAVGENYRRGRFADVEGTPSPEDFAFIARVNELRKGKGTA
jgi:DNA-binding transcriptional MerR regulator